MPRFLFKAAASGSFRGLWRYGAEDPEIFLLTGRLKGLFLLDLLMSGLTQKEIAEHLGMTQQAVSKTLGKMGIEWQSMSLDEVRLAYIQRLREVAAGYASIDGQYDLNRERVLTEQVDRELKLYQLAEKKQMLVNVDVFMTELEPVFQAMRQEMLARDDKLKLELDTLYGINVDVTILNEYTNNTLNHLSRYLKEYPENHGEIERDSPGPGENGDDSMG